MKNYEVAKLVIFVATESELNAIVKPALEKLGLIGRKDIWIIVTGVGKVNSTFKSTILLSSMNAIDKESMKKSMFVNVGVCGGNDLSPDIAGVLAVADNDIAISTDEGVSSNNFIMIGAGYYGGRLDFVNCYTQDQFCVNSLDLPNLIPAYVDMELYGIAYACRYYDVALHAIKSKCATVGDGTKNWTSCEGFEKACERAVNALYDYLNARSGVILNT